MYCINCKQEHAEDIRCCDVEQQCLMCLKGVKPHERYVFGEYKPLCRSCYIDLRLIEDYQP